MGVKWIRQVDVIWGACSSWPVATLKRVKKLNATDETDALLAEAEYIFNNADLFLPEEELHAA